MTEVSLVTAGLSVVGHCGVIPPHGGRARSRTPFGDPRPEVTAGLLWVGCVGRLASVGVQRVVPDLASRSLEEGERFYSQVLGLQPVMDHGWIVTLADPDQPGSQISLMTHDTTAPVVPDVSIQVHDVGSAYAAAVEQRVPRSCIPHRRTVGRASLLRPRPRWPRDQRAQSPLIAGHPAG